MNERGKRDEVEDLWTDWVMQSFIRYKHIFKQARDKADLYFKLMAWIAVQIGWEGEESSQYGAIAAVQVEV